MPSTEKNTQAAAPADVLREPATGVAESDGARNRSTFQNTVAVVPIWGNTDVPIPQYVDILMFKLVNRRIQTQNGQLKGRVSRTLILECAARLTRVGRAR